VSKLRSSLRSPFCKKNILCVILLTIVISFSMISILCVVSPEKITIYSVTQKDESIKENLICGSSRQSTYLIGGYVNNSASTPISEVIVILTDDGGNTRINITSTSGYFSFSSLLPGSYNLTFKKEGYISEGRFVVITNSDVMLDIILRLSGRLIGVISSSSGFIEGARVRIYDSSSLLIDSKITDNSGFYNFSSDLPTGSYTLLVSRNFYIEKTAGPLQIVEGQTAQCNIVLMPSCLIRGIVKNEQGNPLPNAHVTFKEGLEDFSEGTTTNSTGQYQFTENIPEGTYNIMAEKEGYLPQIKEVTLSPSNWVNLDFVLVKATVLTGNVTDASNLPIANALVTLVNLETNYSTTTDGLGGYELSTELYGICTLIVSAEGYITSVEEVTLIKGEKNVFDVSLTPAALVECVVRDELGCLISDAKVWSIFGLEEVYTYTDEVGRAWFYQNFSDGTYTFHAWKPGFCEASIEATLTFENTTILEFTLIPFLTVYKPLNGSVSLNGTINITGRTQPGAVVKFFVNGEEVGDCISNSDGNFLRLCNLTRTGENTIKIESSAFLTTGQYSEYTEIVVIRNMYTPMISIHTLPGQIFYSSPATITGNVSDLDSDDIVSVYARLGNGLWTSLGTDAFWAYEFEFTFDDNGNRTVEIMAVDLGGNVARQYINVNLEIPASASSLSLVPSITKFGKPGKSVNFECWVSNYGQNSDTIIINISAQHSWKFDYQVSEKGVKINERQLSFSLLPKEIGNFTIKVSVPKQPTVLEENILIKASSTTSAGLIRFTTLYVKTELPVTSSGINWYIVTGVLAGIIAIVIIGSGMYLMNKMANVTEEETSYSPYFSSPTTQRHEKKGIFSFLNKGKEINKESQAKIRSQADVGTQTPTSMSSPQTTFRSYDSSYEKSISYGEGSVVQSVSMGSGEYTPYYADVQGNFQPQYQTNQPLQTTQAGTQTEAQNIQETDKTKSKIPVRALPPKVSTSKPKIVEPKFDK